jgi:hypothetical protein
MSGLSRLAPLCPWRRGKPTPDLVVVCKGQATDWVIIENKLKADEGKDQTKRYADPQMKAALSKKLELDASAGPPKLVFLTLFSDQVPKSERFSRACYSSLLHGQPLSDQDGDLTHQLLSDWLELLEEFYASAHLDPGEVFVEKLSCMHALDSGYLAFRSLIRGLSLPAELTPDHFFCKSERGRKYYGTALTKPEWKTEPFDNSGRQWILPEDNRRIHIEPQYNVLAQTLKVYVHYETNPYYRGSTLEQRVPPDQYETYITRRRAFAQHFTNVGADSFKVRVRTNQLASVEVSLSGKKVTEVQQEMKELIEVAAEAIDEALTAEWRA